MYNYGDDKHNMSTFASVYVQCRPGEPVARLFEELQTTLEANESWTCMRYQADKAWVQLEADILDVGDCAREIADTLKDCRVVGLACQSVSDSAGYWEYQDGREVRVLVYGMEEEGIWDEVRGKEQPWQREIFFSGKEAGENKALISEGAMEPFFLGSELQKIGEILSLPGFASDGMSPQWTKEYYR
jgi:hypothetical protein